MQTLSRFIAIHVPIQIRAQSMASYSVALAAAFPSTLQLPRVKPPFRSSFSGTHFTSRAFTPLQAHPKSVLACRPFSLQAHSRISISGASSDDDLLDSIENNESLTGAEARPLKFLFLVLLWASVSIGFYAFSRDARAAADSIRTSGFGIKVANVLRSSGWPDEAVVFSLATLPVIELRGAIPVGYWLQLNPIKLTLLSILGNIVPVPVIMLFLKKLALFLAERSRTASGFLDMVFKRAKQKAGPVEEFRWLGLMLFVAVPFPGTGAWTGAIIASVLDMPFWDGVSANLVGVVLAGLLVNMLVNLGVKYALAAGCGLFLVSTFMWSALRGLRRSLSALN